MRVLILHNRYQYAGGEDIVVSAEANLLRGAGQNVKLLQVDNDEIVGLSKKLGAAARATWSRSSRALVNEELLRFAPELVHVHNTFPVLSPAVFYACGRYGVPVVQTLHNFRLICPGALLFREHTTCEQCVGRTIPWAGVIHGCYRGSRAATAAVAGMLSIHRAVGTWRKRVDAYIALTAFARQKLVQGGLPASKIYIKPNFVPGEQATGSGDGGYALFVGRLSPEKGVSVLLEAWRKISRRVPLKVAGTGPLQTDVTAAAAEDPLIEYLGQVPSSAVQKLMQSAAVVIVPSLCYENFPMVIAEALSAGTPVLASGIGAMAEIVADGRTGLLFRAGDAAELAATVQFATSNPELLARMRLNARAEYEAKYTPARNYEALISIYEAAIANRRAVQVSATAPRGRFPA